MFNRSRSWWVLRGSHILRAKVPHAAMDVASSRTQLRYLLLIRHSKMDLARQI